MENNDKKLATKVVIGIVIGMVLCFAGGLACALFLGDKNKKNNDSTTTTTAVQGGTQTTVNDPTTIDEYKKITADKIKADLVPVLLDDTFKEVALLGLDECKGKNNQKITKTVDGREFNVTCYDETDDSPDSLGYKGTVDGSHPVENAYYTCGGTNYYSINNYFVRFDTSCEEDTGTITIYYGTSRFELPTTKGNGVVWNSDDYRGIVPYMYNKSLYFVEKEDQSDVITKVDLSSDKPVLTRLADIPLTE